MVEESVDFTCQVSRRRLRVGRRKGRRWSGWPLPEDLRWSAVIKTDDGRAQRQCLCQTQPGFLVKRRVQHGAGGRKPRQQYIPRQPSFELHAVSDVPPARGTLETTPFRAAAAKDQSRVRAPDMSERAQRQHRSLPANETSDDKHLSRSRTARARGRAEVDDGCVCQDG